MGQLLEKSTTDMIISCLLKYGESAAQAHNADNALVLLLKKLSRDDLTDELRTKLEAIKNCASDGGSGRALKEVVTSLTTVEEATLAEPSAESEQT